MGGGVISPELYDQLAEMFQWFKTQKRQAGDEPTGTAARPPTRFQPTAVILDEKLDEGEFLNPVFAEARVCTWDNDAKTYEQSGEQIEVANHSEESHDVDTAGAAFWLDGHWWFFGDCSAIEDRPAPPALT